MSPEVGAWRSLTSTAVGAEGARKTLVGTLLQRSSVCLMGKEISLRRGSCLSGYSPFGLDGRTFRWWHHSGEEGTSGTGTVVAMTMACIPKGMLGEGDEGGEGFGADNRSPLQRRTWRKEIAKALPEKRIWVGEHGQTVVPGHGVLEEAAPREGQEARVRQVLLVLIAVHAEGAVLAGAEGFAGTSGRGHEGHGHAWGTRAPVLLDLHPPRPSAAHSHRWTITHGLARSGQVGSKLAHDHVITDTPRGT